MSKPDPGRLLWFVTREYRSFQGLRLLPAAVWCFFAPAARAGWFGPLLPIGGRHVGEAWEWLAWLIAILAWWILGRYYRRVYGVATSHPRIGTSLLVLLLYVALTPLSRRANIDLGALWLAGWCVAEARRSFGLRPHFFGVAALLTTWALIPLFAPLPHDSLWAVSDVFNGLCLLVIAIGDHVALRRALRTLTTPLQQMAHPAS
jgi:hypothetical protein